MESALRRAQIALRSVGYPTRRKLTAACPAIALTQEVASVIWPAFLRVVFNERTPLPSRPDACGQACCANHPYRISDLEALAQAGNASESPPAKRARAPHRSRYASTSEHESARSRDDCDFGTPEVEGEASDPSMGLDRPTEATVRFLLMSKQRSSS